MIGAAVIGLGVGMLHCEGYVKSRYAKLLAVCVKEREEKLREARKRFGKVDTYKGYREVLERDDIDLVSVVTPNYTHYQIAIKAIEAGKHVMLEKPMALTLEEAQRLVIAAEKNSVKLGVNFCCRFTPRFAEIRRLIDGGDAGNITSVAAYSWRKPFNPNKPWCLRSKYVGSMVLEMPIHFFDLLRWYAGEVKQVHALMGSQIRKEMDYEQVAFVNLEFESGAVGQLSETINGFGLYDTIWAIGTKASILACSPHPAITGTRGILMFKPHQRDMMDDWRLDIVRRKTFDETDLLRKIIVRHLQEFIKCIVRDKDPPVTGEDGRKAVEICLAAEKSAIDETPIKLPLEETPPFAVERLQR